MLFDFIDVLVTKFEEIILPELKQYRDESYKKGFREPTFWSTKEPMLHSRRVPDQNKYKYSSKTMDDKTVSLNDAAIQQSLYENYRFVIDNHQDEISDEVLATLKEAMELHAPKKE